MIQSLWKGFSVPYRATQLVFSRFDLIFLSALPALVTLALYSWIYNRAMPIFQRFLETELAGRFEWMGPWIFFLTQAFSVVIGFLTFSFTANLLSIPLNDLLAQRVETRLGMTDVPTYKWTHTLRVIWIDLFRTVFLTFLSLIFLLVSWVPVINLLSFSGTILLYSFQYLTYPQVRRMEPLSKSIGFLFRHFWTFFGMGLSFSLLSLIPFSTVILLPIAVVSGTLLFHEQRQL